MTNNLNFKLFHISCIKILNTVKASLYQRIHYILTLISYTPTYVLALDTTQPIGVARKE